MKIFINSLISTIIAFLLFSCSDDSLSPLKPTSGEPDESKIYYEVKMISLDYYCPYARYVLEDNQGNLWSAVMETNLLRYVSPYVGIFRNGKNFHFRTSKLPDYTGGRFKCFFKDNRGRIWFAMSGSGTLFCIDNGNMESIYPPEGRSFLCASLRPNGKILAAISHLGFAEVDPETKAIQMITDTIKSPVDIGNSYMSAIDSYGNYWEAGFDVDNSKPDTEVIWKFKMYNFRDSSQYSALGMNENSFGKVSDICPFGNGNCVFSTWTDVSWIVDGKQSFLSELCPNLLYISGTPVVVAPESESVFWLGTGNGLFKIRDGRIVASFNDNDAILPGRWITSIRVDKDKNVWIVADGYYCKLAKKVRD